MPFKVFRDGQPITFIHDGQDQSPALMGITRDKVDTGFKTREEALTAALFHAGWWSRTIENLDVRTWETSQRRRELYEESREFTSEAPGLWSMTIDRTRYTFQEVGAGRAH